MKACKVVAIIFASLASTLATGCAAAALWLGNTTGRIDKSLVAVLTFATIVLAILAFALFVIGAGILMARKQQTDAAPPEEPQQMDVDFPVLPTDVQIGLFTTPEGAYAILNCANVLVRGTFPLDRAQTIELGSQLIKLGRRMPKPPKQIEVPHAPGESTRDSGLVIPGA